MNSAAGRAVRAAVPVPAQCSQDRWSLRLCSPSSCLLLSPRPMFLPLPLSPVFLCVLAASFSSLASSWASSPARHRLRLCHRPSCRPPPLCRAPLRSPVVIVAFLFANGRTRLRSPFGLDGLPRKRLKRPTWPKLVHHRSFGRLGAVLRPSAALPEAPREPPSAVIGPRKQPWTQ